MVSKKGYIISYGDWFKGFIIGALVGAVLAYLVINGILKVPAYTAKDAASKAMLLLPLAKRF
ncbi:hypothetical protein HY640_02645 [Candidatus Woesearchaeota archaeon]|nr:hypothetical protein [Candidatus Woesearchaeota archaeon]